MLRLVRSWSKLILQSPRRLLGLSLPVRVAGAVAVGVALFLSICVAGFVAVRIHHQEPVWDNTLQAQLLIGLLVAIPIVSYFTVYLWLQPDTNRFPEIDAAWHAGLEALHRSGVDFQSTPLFLVLGARNVQQLTALMREADLSSADGLDANDSPLKWSWSSDRIYLACPVAGELSELARQLAGNAAALEPVKSVDSGQQEQCVAVPLDKVWTERLVHICKLLRQFRRRVHPLAGVLVLIPFRGLQATSGTADSLREGLRKDLKVIPDSAQACCAASVLVVDLETNAGFRELVKRSSLSKRPNARLGSSSSVNQPATDEHIQKVAYRACATFIEESERVLHQSLQGAVGAPANEASGPANDSRPPDLGTDHKLVEELRGNWNLYLLTGLFRDRIRKHLSIVLQAFEQHQEGARRSDRTSVSFGGCYFASAGNAADRGAFVREPLRRLKDDLGPTALWSRTAIAASDHYRRLRTVFRWTNGLLVVIVIVLAIVGWQLGWFESTLGSIQP